MGIVSATTVSIREFRGVDEGVRIHRLSVASGITTTSTRPPWGKRSWRAVRSRMASLVSHSTGMRSTIPDPSTSPSTSTMPCRNPGEAVSGRLFASASMLTVTATEPSNSPASLATLWSIQMTGSPRASPSKREDSIVFMPLRS